MHALGALTDFVNSLAAQDAKVELVINGDMVDFLAEQAFAPFTADPAKAGAKLQAIAGRDKPFFDALANLLNRDHRLTILLGNHDTELAMPPVRRKLREILGVQVHHDYELISNGEAYADRRGADRAWQSLRFLEHGQLQRLRSIASLMSRDQPLPAMMQFDPPAGSKMVAWVINLIKQDYKFVDLLKPETDMAIPIVLALEPGYRRILATVAKLANQARQHQMEKDHGARPSIGDDISSTDATWTAR